jgi:MFS transporter, ACS family, hexuronate transporter
VPHLFYDRARKPGIGPARGVSLMSQMVSAERRPILKYENALLILLGLSFGFAFFDRNSASVLIPYMAKDLSLTNTQSALINSVLSFMWALGAYVIARWSDARGSRKPFLLAFLVIFSACSILSGLAHSFPVLLASRAIMGAVEGPFLPVCLAIMAVESSPSRRGVNAGIMQNFFAALLGQSLAPWLLPVIAEEHGWRAAFFVAGVPGLLCALAIWLWVREPTQEAQAALRSAATTDATDSGRTMGLFDMLAVRNVFVCCLISVFMVGWFVMGWTFLPKFLTSVRGMPGPAMGSLLSVLGFASAVSGFGAPWLSDRLGRKPVMIGFCLVGALTALGAVYFQGSTVALGALLFVGWLATGTFPLFMGVIPGESIPRQYAATAMGLVVCVGEVLGGSGLVALAGRFADLTQLSNAVLMMAASGAIGCVLCFFLVETAPIKERARIAQAMSAKAA